MARRDLEPAIRLRISPATDAVLSRTGVLLIRGDRVFRIDDREMRRLSTEIGDGTVAEAVSRLLAAEDGETT